jgi:hypothetical protein
MTGSMGCNAIIKQGYKLQHPNGLYLTAVAANDVVEGWATFRLTLSASATLLKQKDTNTTTGYIHFKDVLLGKWVRSSASYLYEQAVTATISNFQFRAVQAAVGKFYYYNVKVYVIGYNATLNRLTLVSLTDPSAVAWQVSNYLS